MRTILLSSLVLCAAASAAHAFNPQPDPPGFPLHGITLDQVARVSVVNTGTTTCNVTMRFFDQDGDQLAQQTAAIAPGEQGFLVINGADVVPGGGLRALVRPVVSRSDNLGAAPPDPCKASFMIRDLSNGATTFAVSRFVPPDPLLPPDPLRAAPLVVPSQNQKAVLVYANTSPDPSAPACQGTLSFRAPGGRTLATRTVTLAPGQATTLEVTGGGSPVWGLISSPQVPPDPCMGTFELYNASTGAIHVGGTL